MLINFLFLQLLAISLYCVFGQKYPKIHTSNIKTINIEKKAP